MCGICVQLYFEVVVAILVSLLLPFDFLTLPLFLVLVLLIPVHANATMATRRGFSAGDIGRRNLLQVRDRSLRFAPLARLAHHRQDSSSSN